MLQLPSSNAHAATRARRAATPRQPRLLAAVVFGLLGVLAACGGDDAAEGQASVGDSGTEASDGAGSGEGSGGGDASGGDEVFDAATVQACLDDAGFVTVTSSELLNEQQVADQLTAFGQTESLTFDAEQNAFAGEVSFYETPEQAGDRAESLGAVAKTQVLVGNALVNIAAGSDYDAAVEAAESCLSS